jgi:hypothetical protein
MSLELLKTALQTAEAQALITRMTLDAWAADTRMRAEKVAMFRRYADGDHDATLTTEMREMLRISSTGSMERFNLNHCDRIIQSENNRLKVTGFDTGNDAANAWIADLLRLNRFDGLQTDVHEAALRDADTYVMASWDSEAKRIVWTQEPAYDGKNGMVVRYTPFGQLAVALKIWTQGSATRVNVYHIDRIEKYISRDGGNLQRYEEEGQPWPLPWLMKGQPIGVGVVHFPNRGTSYDDFGRSEIEDVIPPQNAINRTLHSMVATSELTGFPIRYAVGWKPPSGLTPGMWIKISEGAPLTSDEKIEIGTMDQGEIVPFIQQMETLINEMYRISDTPAPEFMASSASSGESLKQREIGLLGKINRFQVKIGNRWEDLIQLSARIQLAFGGGVPAFEGVTTKWDSAEIRNDAEVIANAKVLDEMGYQEEALRQMAPVFDWDEDKIMKLLAEKRANTQFVLSSFPGGANGYDLSTELFGNLNQEGVPNG